MKRKVLGLKKKKKKTLALPESVIVGKVFHEHLLPIFATLYLSKLIFRIFKFENTAENIAISTVLYQLL